MKYFLDTEFHEYQKKPLFGKPMDTIELISIGIVSEDIPTSIVTKREDGAIISGKMGMQSREYYAICKDFDLKAAWNNEWLRENVLKSIWIDFVKKEVNCDITNGKWFIGNPYTLKGKFNVYILKRIGQVHFFNFKSFKFLLNKYGKTRKQIAKEIIKFCSAGNKWNYNADKNDIGSIKYCDNGSEKYMKCTYVDNPEFYGYYSDYDWVVFCWLFGRMIDLPKGFPKYCIDLKQELDRQVTNLFNYSIKNNEGVFTIGVIKEGYHGIQEKVTCKEDVLKIIQRYYSYPKQTNEHNALADAKWNHELYKFLNTL